MDPTQSRAAEIFLANYDFVMRCAFRFAPLPDSVDDVIQDTFREFVQHFHRLTITEDARPLLMGITKNVALRYWQKRQRERSKTVQLIGDYFWEAANRQAEETESVDDREWHRREITMLEFCLDKLPKRGREIIDSYYYQGKKVAEIAAQYQKSASGVKQYLFRLRSKLRDCLNRYGKRQVEE